jgi:cullin-associated NEDD8-dissociated protein 1
VGYRLSSHLPNIVPLLYPFCQVSNLNIESPDVDIDHELIEMSLETFESFLKRCPKDITDYVNDIMSRVIELMSYDPNYVYSQKIEEDEDWGSDSDDEAFSQGDDDDSSWKVRRSAVRVIDAIIKSRPEMLSQFYVVLVEKLVSRFVEREENVKLEIF